MNKQHLKLALNQLQSFEEIIKKNARETLSLTMGLEEKRDFYVDSQTGLIILTANYHEKRGYCCGNGCKECPYYPRHIKGNTELKKVGDSLKE